MGVVLLEGFDHLAAGNATAKGWSEAFTTIISGRWGGQGVQMNTNGNIVRTFDGGLSYTELWAGFALRATPNIANTTLFCFRTTAPVNALRLSIDASGQLSLLNSGGGVISGPSSRTINTSVWRFIEIYCLINGASGACQMNYDGSVELPLTTTNLGSVAIGGISWGDVNSSTTDLDDLYVLDNSSPGPTGFLNDARIETSFIQTEGTTTLWTPLSGSDNAAMVDDTTAPDGDSTYVYSANVGDYDTYVSANLSVGSATVHAVKTNLYARKDGAQGGRAISDVIRHGGVDTPGTAIDLSSSYLVIGEYHNQTPASTDWTVADVNAAEFGVKLTT